MILTPRIEAPGYLAIMGSITSNVIVGGRNVSANKFIPAMNLSAHDDEAWLDLNHVDSPMTDRVDVISNGKVLHNSGGFKHEFYTIDNDRLKWDMLFDSAGEVPNSIRFRVNHSGNLSFYKQTITPEEATLGSQYTVPEAEGSYAVYLDKRDNKYQTGKVCHIYSPFFIDGAGAISPLLAMDITPDNNVKMLTLIVTPEVRAWLESSDRMGPFRLDPTLGYSTAGGLSFGSAGVMYSWTWPTDATGGELSAYHCAVQQIQAGFAGIKLAILTIDQATYDPQLKPLITQVAFNAVVSDDNTGVASGTLAASTKYGVAFGMQNTSNKIKYDIGNTDPKLWYKTKGYSDMFPDPSEASWSNSPSGFPWRMSIWWDYAAAVTGKALNRSRLVNMGACGGPLNKGTLANA